MKECFYLGLGCVPFVKNTGSWSGIASVAKLQSIAIIDSGIGNTASLHSAFQKSGVEVVIVSEPGRLTDFRRLVLPGVGNFEAFGRALLRRDLWPAIIDIASRGSNNLLGICVGAQILFGGSEESSSAPGLNLLGGVVRRINPEESEISPRVGWDVLNYSDAFSPPNPAGLTAQARYFFSHSFCMDPTEKSAILATCGNSRTIPAIVRQGNLLAIQFHPERSGVFGQRLLKDFARGLFDVP